jgi:hypothetical protein
MKKNIIVLTLFFAVMLLSALKAQDSTKTQNNQQGQNPVFVDENGDGYNDNAPDHDGDGIPNSLDPDWIKLKKEEKKKESGRFIDLDGDGIDDNLQKGAQEKKRPGGEMNEKGASMEEQNRQQKGQRKQNQNGKK